MASILTSQALTTATNAAAQISGANATTDQALLETFINVASEMICGYCHRTFAYEASHVERQAPPRGRHLVLSLTPIASITSIYVDTALLSGYVLDDAAAGIVWSLIGWDLSVTGYFVTPVTYDRGQTGSPSGAVYPETMRRVLVATYAGGYVLPKDVSAGPPAVVRTLPYELEQAAIAIVASMWRRKGVDLADSEYETRGRGGVVVPGAGMIPQGVIPILDRYRIASVS